MIEKMGAGLCAALVLSGCGPEKSMAEQFPGPWIDDVDLTITRVLIKHKVTGCGQYSWREHVNNRVKNDPYGEYLVYCTRDGANWTAVLVWAGTERIAGPGAVYSDIPVPH